MKVTKLLFALLGLIILVAILLAVVHPAYAKIISFLVGRISAMFEPLFNIIY
jgi:hypothetical protein